jgi:hypothetical protein
MSLIKETEEVKIKRIVSSQDKEIKEIPEKLSLLLIIIPYDVIKIICDYFIRINEQLCIRMWVQKIYNMTCTEIDGYRGCGKLLYVSKLKCNFVLQTHINRNNKLFDFINFLNKYQFVAYTKKMHYHDRVFEIRFGNLCYLRSCFSQKEDFIKIHLGIEAFNDIKTELEQELDWYIEYDIVAGFHIIIIKSISDLHWIQIYLKYFHNQLCEICQEKKKLHNII